MLLNSLRDTSKTSRQASKTPQQFLRSVENKKHSPPREKGPKFDGYSLKSCLLSSYVGSAECCHDASQGGTLCDLARTSAAHLRQSSGSSDKERDEGGVSHHVLA